MGEQARARLIKLENERHALGRRLADGRCSSRVRAALRLTRVMHELKALREAFPADAAGVVERPYTGPTDKPVHPNGTPDEALPPAARSRRRRASSPT